MFIYAGGKSLLPHLNKIFDEFEEQFAEEENLDSLDFDENVLYEDYSNDDE